MSKNHCQDKKIARLAQIDKIRHLFLSLKQTALAILLLGFGLLIILYFLVIPKSLEMMILLLYSFTGMGFIIARTKSALSNLPKEPVPETIKTQHSQDKQDQ